VRRHGNTLYVTSQGAHLAKDGDAVVVRIGGETRLRIPVHLLAGIVCFGRVSASPFLLGFCGERGVGLSFLTLHGRFLARVEGPVRGNVLLRREQYRRADSEAASAEVARAFLLGKLASSRVVLRRALRDRPGAAGAEAVQAACGLLSRCLAEVRAGGDLAGLRGIEGNAARAYFAVFDHLVVQQKEGFFFRERSRRPPLDNLNALLSFLYTLLRHDVEAALESVGLDPQVGFLHRDRPGRAGLALDLMEELRPYVADRLALSLVNLNQVRPAGFVTGESGGVAMDEATRKVVLTAYQRKKDEEITHPFLGETTTVGLLPHLQALLLARHLRGDLDAYPAFVWR
jgi:CRISPR-associated protein Cas1